MTVNIFVHINILTIFNAHTYIKNLIICVYFFQDLTSELPYNTEYFEYFAPDFSLFPDTNPRQVKTLNLLVIFQRSRQESALTAQMQKHAEQNMRVCCVRQHLKAGRNTQHA